MPPPVRLPNFERNTRFGRHPGRSAISFQSEKLTQSSMPPSRGVYYKPPKGPRPGGPQTKSLASEEITPVKSGSQLQSRPRCSLSDSRTRARLYYLSRLMTNPEKLGDRFRFDPGRNPFATYELQSAFYIQSNHSRICLVLNAARVWVTFNVAEDLTRSLICIPRDLAL
jgi:hypothetical protein